MIYTEETDYRNIEMSKRLRNILERNEIKMLCEVSNYPKEYFMECRNMDVKTMQELLRVCEEQGIKLHSIKEMK